MIRSILVCIIVHLAIAVFADAEFIVIDVSGGTDANEYPVTKLEKSPEGGWDEEYKTDKIVLKRIEIPEITFCIGVFEVTQRQWELVTGKRPSYYNNEECYRVRPVDNVSYDDIRGKAKGAEYPKSSDVDELSFLGLLRMKARLPTLDLPTRRQWEAACRDSGGAEDCDNPLVIARRARLGVNCGYYLVPPAAWRGCGVDNGTAKAGMYEPNGHGLYDMCGNVCEWCLDACDETDETVVRLGCTWEEFRPFGKLRVLKGGHCESSAPFCKSTIVYGENSSFTSRSIGLRLACK